VVTVKLDKNDIERARINGGIPVPLPPNIKDYNSALVMIGVFHQLVVAAPVPVAPVPTAAEAPADELTERVIVS
jgi:hypothetical protein